MFSLATDMIEENTTSDELVGKFAEFRREVLLMSGLQHENLVKLIGITTKPLCMITGESSNII